MLSQTEMLFDFLDGPSSPPEHPRLGSAQGLSASSLDSNDSAQTGTHAGRVIGFGGSDRLSILFAVFTLICGLYCIGYIFRGADPEHRIRAWPPEFFYQRPPESMASEALGGHLQKTGDNAQSSAINPSSPRSGNPGQPASDHSSSPSLSDKKSLSSSDHPGTPSHQGSAGSTSRGNSDAREGSTQSRGSMKAAKNAPQKHPNKNGATYPKGNGTSSGVHTPTVKSSGKTPSQLNGGNHPRTAGGDSAPKAATGAPLSSRRDSSSPRAFSGMRSMPGGR